MSFKCTVNPRRDAKHSSAVVVSRDSNEIDSHNRQRIPLSASHAAFCDLSNALKGRKLHATTKSDRNVTLGILFVDSVASFIQASHSNTSDFCE